MQSVEPVRVLLLVTGSVAAVKVGLLLEKLRSSIPSTITATTSSSSSSQIPQPPLEVKVAATDRGFFFLERAQIAPGVNVARPVAAEPSTITTASPAGRSTNINAGNRVGNGVIDLSTVYCDADEWKSWEIVGDDVLHIELRRWADMLLIAPLDANTLAKASHGISDNLVTCVLRAWETKKKPVIVCPAMNTAMWEHPATNEQLNVLRGWLSPDTPPNNAMMEDGVVPLEMFQIVGPVAKKLACGDIGVGGMSTVEDIALAVHRTALSIAQARQVKQ